MAGPGSMLCVFLAMAWVATLTADAYERIGEGLTEIPTDFPADESEVYLSENQISDTTRLSDLTSLVKLDLMKNKISAFPNLTRSGSTLVSLKLGWNEISEVPIALVRNLTALRLLNLGLNLLAEFPDFSPIAATLMRLSLFANNIEYSDLDVQRFNELVQLRVLTLNNNKYPEMPDLGEGCLEMRDLQLLRTKMAIINPETLRHCTLVRYLNIADNRLVSFPDLKYLGASLKTLDIRGNQLRVVDDALTLTLQSLESVDMDDNQLTSFPNFCASADTLTDLSLQGNSITTVDEETLGCLVNLVNLTLAHNALSSFPDASGLTLQGLDLQHNLFLAMPVLKAMGQNITALYMNNNPMERISDEAVLVLDIIEFLYLQGTNVSTLPDIAVVADTLHTLFISTQEDPTPISTITAENMAVLDRIPVVSPDDWRDYLIAECGDDARPAGGSGRESMTFYQGGAMCPGEEPEGAELGGVGLDDCLLLCVHSPACSAVHFSLTTGCLLGKAAPGGRDEPSTDGSITYSTIDPGNTESTGTQ